ncbi:MAG TPA: sulfotransferase [Bryobacteraceae bacterium]
MGEPFHPDDGSGSERYEECKNRSADSNNRGARIDGIDLANALGVTVNPDSAPWMAARAALRAGCEPRHPRLKEAAAALEKNQVDDAARILSKFLDTHPGDIDALNFVAELLMERKRYEDAERVLARCVAGDAHFDLARFNLATALFYSGELRPAIDQIGILLRKNAHNPLYCDLMAASLSNAGLYHEALDYRHRLTEKFSSSGWAWLSYGRSLRAVGRREECIAAYRRAIELSPALGRAWWELAHLKNYRFTERETELMRAQVAQPNLLQEERPPLHYALGKACGDLGAWAKSFNHYARANAMLCMTSPYEPDRTTARASSIRALFTMEFFAERAGAGCSARDPIFIVGMQRAGSTLVEQILASHSAIEGTGERTDMARFAKKLHDDGGPLGPDYARNLRALDRDGLRREGEAYLERIEFRRVLGRPHFADKQPYNFWHVGLIHLVLPHAKIIDVRRHPVACCFSNFTQNYVTETAPFSHRLADLARHYRDYVDVMAHFDRVLPGRIYRLNYEQLVAEPAKEIHQLLDHLGLPFESACLEFYRNDRAMDSASSEQVRSPIFVGAVDWWRNYEPWLAPLKSALGPALTG